MLLTATTAKLQIILAAAVASAQAQVSASYADMTSTAHTPGSQQATSNGTTAADIVSAPAASTQRKVTMLSVYNADTASITATIRRNDNATITNLVTVAIPAGYTLFWTDVDGWSLGVTSAQGAPGPTGSPGLNGVGNVTINAAQTGAYTFVLGDAGDCTPFNASSAANFTVPPNSSVAFAVGTILYVRQQGSAAATLVAGAGVTLNTPNGAATGGVGDWRAAVKVATDTWDVL